MQDFDLQFQIGKSDPSFPIQKKRASREFLRTKAHLRSRTNTFGAVRFPILSYSFLPYLLMPLLNHAKEQFITLL